VAACVTPLFLAGRAKLIFLINARSSRLIPSSSNSLHLAKYECTVRHLGKSLGKARHRHPPRSKYSTAHHTSYKSTTPHFGALAHLLQYKSTHQSKSRASRVMSLVKLRADGSRRHKILGASGKNSRCDIKRE